MDDGHDGCGTQAREREEVAYVCDQLDYIRTTLERYGSEGPEPLERALGALRTGAPAGERLRALHEALLAAGDAAGLHGQARGPNLSGFDAPVPGTWVLLCPTGRCARYAWPDGQGSPGAPAPASSSAAVSAPPCRISGEPLRRERL
ncbi:hypothetical protein ACFQVC_10810 [Streptomyces monticola]|uniref:Uncharacterized protein n=1 Tax=Streptomyces monticola TaxID=2666263 RepID=A0ABW2JF90_9ACTN